MSEHRGIVSDPWLPVRWPEYTPPKSAVAALAQMPAYLIDGYSLSDAYMRDCRALAARDGLDARAKPSSGGAG